MSPKVKIIAIVSGVLVVILLVVFLSYFTTRKAMLSPTDEEPAQKEIDITSEPDIGRFKLGEFVASSRDDAMHYIKVEIELGFIGELEKELEARTAELRDAVTSTLMRLNIQRAKEDYIDNFLHKDIERELNRVLGRSTSESRIVKVFIPTFLIN